MDGLGNWFDGKNPFPPEAAQDLRRPFSGSWIPSESILNPNGTTDGCLEITKTGILSTKIDTDCNVEKRPACEYKTCMTTKGKKCLFPFAYKNNTHPSLTYRICSGLDVYRPWCPTELDDALNVLEWGDCLDDCPKEPINSACLTDPLFPAVSDGTSKAVNYTTDYQVGISVYTDEFDYVTFECPEGYIFEGSNNRTHIAVCVNWEFIYLYDSEVLCVRKITLFINESKS